MSENPIPFRDIGEGGDVQPPDQAESSVQFSSLMRAVGGNTDGRKPYDWKSKYDAEAQLGMAFEEKRLLLYLALSLLLEITSLMLSGQIITIPIAYAASALDGNREAIALSINSSILVVFFAGSVGGTTFALKWLVHSCATGKWHLDRRPWRLIVPLLGGVYSCVMLTLLDAGMFGHSGSTPRPLAVSAALGFLVGYFSDGVSGLLSNIANAVFGTLEKK